MILSLASAASEWIRHLGLPGELVEGSGTPPSAEPAGTPPSAEPPIFRAHVRAPASAEQVERAIALCPNQPNLIVVDGVAGDWTGTEARFREALGPSFAWLPWEPTTLRDILEFALRSARILGAMQPAMKVLGDQEAELRRWREACGVHRRAPDVALPRIAMLGGPGGRVGAGRWAVETVDRAAGLLVPARAEGLPGPVTTEDLDRTQPRKVVLVGQSPVPLDIADWCGARGAELLRYEAPDGLLRGGPGVHGAIGDVMSLLHGVPHPAPGPGMEQLA
jgi:hypothetical protein